jgi:hypothetical protein
MKSNMIFSTPVTTDEIKIEPLESVNQFALRSGILIRNNNIEFELRDGTGASTVTPSSLTIDKSTGLLTMLSTSFADIGPPVEYRVFAKLKDCPLVSVLSDPFKIAFKAPAPCTVTSYIADRKGIKIGADIYKF